MGYAWSNGTKKDDEEQQMKYAWNAPLDRQYTVREGPTMLQPNSIAQTPVVNKTLTTSSPEVKKKGSSGLGSFKDIGKSLLGGAAGVEKFGLALTRQTNPMLNITSRIDATKKPYETVKNLLDTTEKKNKVDTSNMNFGGKAVNFVANQAPSLAAYALLPETGLTAKIGSKLEPLATNAVKKYGVDLASKSLASGLEFGGLSGGQTAIQGGKPKEILNSTKQGAEMGLAFGAGGKVVGDLIKIPSNIKDMKQQGLNQAFETKFGEIKNTPTINNPNNVLKTPQKAVSELNPLINTNTPRINLKPNGTLKPNLVVEKNPSKAFDYNKNQLEIAETGKPVEFIGMRYGDKLNHGETGTYYGINKGYVNQYSPEFKPNENLIKHDNIKFNNPLVVDGEIGGGRKYNLVGTIQSKLGYTSELSKKLSNQLNKVEASDWKQSDVTELDKLIKQGAEQLGHDGIVLKRKTFMNGELNATELIDLKGTSGKPNLLNNTTINKNDLLGLKKLQPVVEKNVPTVSEPITPQEISNTNIPKYRKFISNSVMNSEVAPQVMKNTVPKPKYVPIKNQTTWENALDRVDKDHEGSIKEFAKQRELKSADDTALGQALITKAIKENRISDANDLSIDLAEKLTKAGQTVQAASIFKRLTPEGMLQYANKTINKVNEVNVKNGKVGNVKLSESEATDIVERMNRINSMEDGRAKDVEMGKVFNIVNSKVPSNIVDKVRTLRNISLLGNIKTNVRNVTGNALMGITDNLSNVVATPIDKLISMKTGQRSAALPSLKIQGKGFIEGGKIGISDSFGGLSKADLAGKAAAEKRALLKEGFLNPINTDMTTNGKFETGKGLTFQNAPLRIAENAVGTALKVGDKTFSQAYYDDVLNQLMKANKVDIATPEMKSIAENVAKERTYQDNNNVTKMLMSIKNSPQRLKGEKSKNITQVAMDTILPYVKTPANILKRGIEYTPIGIGEGLSKASKAIKTGDLAMQRQAVDRLGRGIVGTGLMGGGALLAKNGIATGAADKDKDIAALNKQVGKIPYSLKLPNGKNIDYSWLQPTSMPFSAGVQMAQKGKGNVANNAWGAASNALNFYTEQPMLQSVQRILGNSNDSKGLGQRLLESQLQLPNQLVPTALKQATQTIDGNTRSNYSPDFLKQALINPVKNKIPGVSESLPKVYDTLGREVKVSQGNNNIFNTAINPANVTKDKTSDVEKMVLDVYKNTSDATVFPRVAPKYITSGKDRYDLSSKEYAAYQKEIGENTRSMLEGLLTNSNFMNNGADEKAKIIKSGIDKVNKAARDSYLSSKKKTN